MLNWKSFGSLFVMLGLLATLVLGCGTPVSQPTATVSQPTATVSQPTATVSQPTATDDSKPVELKFHFQDPLQGPMGRGFETWAKEVAEKTDGKVTVTLYPSATLGPGSKGIELAKDGISDISWASIGFYAGRFPLTEMLNAPMMGLKNAKQGSKIAWELYNTSEDLQKEWAQTGTKIIALMSGGETPIGSSKQIKSMNDFKGLKIRTVGGTPTEFFKQVGAIPAVIPATEMYQQMEKGVIDAWTIDWQAVQAFKMTEITPFFNRFNTSFYTSIHVIVMNNDAYAKIPAKYKETFDSLIGDHFSQIVSQNYDESIGPAIKAANDNGQQVVYLPADVEAQLATVADKVINDYATQVDAKGLAGTKTLELIKALVEKYPQ